MGAEWCDGIRQMLIQNAIIFMLPDKCVNRYSAVMYTIINRCTVMGHYGKHIWLLCEGRPLRPVRSGWSSETSTAVDTLMYH